MNAIEIIQMRFRNLNLTLIILQFALPLMMQPILKLKLNQTQPWTWVLQMRHAEQMELPRKETRLVRGLGSVEYLYPVQNAKME